MFLVRGREPELIDRRERGVAMILVLGALALMSFLVVAILSMARTEDRAAKASAEILEVRGLAELPLQLVISQIRRATSNLGMQFTWASQPGMIRVYSNETSETRAPLYEVFKLYSSETMTVLGADFEPLKEVEKLKEWANYPSVFTDLNSPLPVRPIQKVGGTAPNALESDVKYIYPILDPEALGLVDGFEVNSSAVPGATEAQPMPMPAAWMYVLRDGRMITPVSGEATKAVFPASQVSAQNPIVGRIAFWTDDESCKLNLNTATEPAPWEAPRMNSGTDHAYAEYQPALNEFHRLSGHPAFTALSPVFRSFGKDAGSQGGTNAFEPMPDPVKAGGFGSFNENTGSDAERFKDYVESNHRLAPRTSDHSSGNSRERGSNYGTRAPTEPEILKGERLYSTIDELLFNPARTPQSVTGDGLQGAATLTPEDVRRVRFFLTTRSAAPELNPFNRPKISLWPVQAEDSELTDLDKKMCIAATFAGHAHYWQRQRSWKSEANPGSSQSRSEDALITRNAVLLGYLQDMTERPMPGYGNSFLEKYGETNRDHLILSMFDSVRSGVNIENVQRTTGDVQFRYLPPSRGTGVGAQPAVGEYSAVPLAMASNDSEGTAMDVKGYGRFPTVGEVAVVFVATAAQKNTNGEGYLDADGDQLADKTTKVRAFVILEPFVPSPGQPASSPAVRYGLQGLDAWQLGGTALGFPKGIENGKTGPMNRCTFSATRLMNNLALGGNASPFNGLEAQFLTTEGQPKEIGVANEEEFPWVSEEIVLNPPVEANQKMAFKGGLIKLEIRPGMGAVADVPVIQTMELQFPDVEIPVPQLIVSRPDNESLNARFALANVKGQLRQGLIQKGDVVRSMELDPAGPTKGDYRILASLHMVPKEFFRPVSRPPIVGTAPLEKELHTLRSGAYTEGGQHGAAFPQNEGRMAHPAVAGQLVASAAAAPVPEVRLFPYPAAVPGMDGARNFSNRFGDWDNGPGLIEDGPYVNRWDFGNLISERNGIEGGGYYSRKGPFVSEDDGITQTPLRQISSAVAFGSLPTGVYGQVGASSPQAVRPWQTLLFSPNPPSRATAPGATLTQEDHFGFMGVPDHQWLEFFWMPVIEPRPLSVAMATEGKVNLNHQIMPYTYIRRATALHGALEGVRITAIHQSATADITSTAHPKSPDPKNPSSFQFRYAVNITATLKGMDEDRFNQGDIFRSASEICETFLVPKRLGEPEVSGDVQQATDHKYGDATPTTGLTRSNMVEWWNGKADAPGTVDAFEPTGDQARESPYAQIYPRICTRSNVYQVHYKVQFLRKSRSTEPHVWDEAKDRVASEQRGSATVERYLDTMDTTQPDHVLEQETQRAVDDDYHYRIIQRQPFAP